MSHDEEPKTTTTTRPPPAEAEDLYDETTAVGQASPDILAIARQSDDAAEEADRPSDAPTRIGPLAADVAKTAPPPRAASEARPGLPPAVGIGLLFVAVTVVLAALVR